MADRLGNYRIQIYPALHQKVMEEEEWQHQCHLTLDESDKPQVWRGFWTVFIVGK
jgi:hypothetical protein